MTSELQRLSDPNYAIAIAVGPPFPQLVPQQPGTGLVLAGRYSNGPRRWVEYLLSGSIHCIISSKGRQFMHGYVTLL